MVSLSDGKNIRRIYFTKKKYDHYILWDDYLGMTTRDTVQRERNEPQIILL